MEVIIEHLGAVQFEIKSRQHTLISDQPAENKGYDEGMTPPELLLASLGSCAAYYAVDYLVRNKIARGREDARHGRKSEGAIPRR